MLADAQGRPLTGRGMHNEVSVSKKMGNSVMSAAAYLDRVNHDSVGGSGVMDMKAEKGMALVADPVTGTFQLATGSFAGRGVSVSLQQHLTPMLAASVQYDLVTAVDPLLGTSLTLQLENRDRTARTGPPDVLALVLHGKVVRSGTTMRAEYRWQPQESLTQVNAYNADPNEAYLSFYLRQRLGCGRFLPNGLDAVVEATNLLEQGYQPVLAADGHTLFLAQMPRAIQAGLAFNF